MVRIPTQITTIIWDLDGTLLNSFAIHEEIMAEVLPRHGIEVPTRETLLKNYHGKLEESIGNALGQIGEPELLAIVRDFLEIDNAYIKEVGEHLFADAVHLAQRAAHRGVRQVLVTNRAHGVNRGLASPRTMIEHSVLKEVITEFICGDEATCRKPDQRVIAPFFPDGYDPAQIFVIGDQFVDGQFAHNLRANGVVVQRHGSVAHLEKLEDGWADHVRIVDSLDEVEV